VNSGPSITSENSPPSPQGSEGEDRGEVGLRAQEEIQLFEAYQDWRRLGELEGEGIRTRDWTLVTDCQKKLAVLQSRIIRLTNHVRDDWHRTGVDLAQKEKSLSETVSSLIELEMRNSASLNAAKETTRAQMDELDVARQNLKRVHRTYSQSGPGVWNSFS
jgi:hypothetical protein